MALDNAVFGAIADAMHIAINAIAKKLGHSEIEVKKIEGYIFWLLVGTLRWPRLVGQNFSDFK